MPTARQSVVAAAVAAALLALLGWQALRSSGRSLDAGFWFEDVSYGAREAMAGRLGGELTRADFGVIERVARAEIAAAFSFLPLAFTDSRNATYRVRVVQELRNAMRPRFPGPAGESRSIPGIGGQGSVNFRAMVSSAVAHAPEGVDRSAIVEAIGRGIGRTAVHEFAHQLLRSAPIDTGVDRSSYEFRTADRFEHFYGTLHWGHAKPLLERRLGVGRD